MTVTGSSIAPKVDSTNPLAERIPSTSTETSQLPANMPNDPIQLLSAAQGSFTLPKRLPKTSASPSPPHNAIRAVIPIGESCQ